MPLSRFPLPWMTLRMLLAAGILYLIMMGSTFSSLGVVLPHMIAALGMNWSQAGFGFTLLALAAGLSSPLPALTIRKWGGRATIGLGVLVLMTAYAVLALAGSVPAYDLGALLLGIGFSLIGAVPALHILGGWQDKHRSLVFGAYLAFGGLGGALWPALVHGGIAFLGDWRLYWWAMVALMALAGAAGVACLRDPPAEAAADKPGNGADIAPAKDGWKLADALRTPQFYVVGLAISATYLVASVVNAFTVSFLTMKGVAAESAVLAFSVQSACHALFPLLMGGLAVRLGAKTLLLAGVVIQAAGMAAVAGGSSTGMLMVFAIGVGGGYGTVFLATTLALQSYFGRRHYAAIFAANQLFSTVSVIGSSVVGLIADATGRFDVSYAGCALLLAVTALATATLRRPEPAGRVAVAGT